jgi:hypothetical protein
LEEERLQKENRRMEIAHDSAAGSVEVGSFDVLSVEGSRYEKLCVSFDEDVHGAARVDTKHDALLGWASD